MRTTATTARQVALTAATLLGVALLAGCAPTAGAPSTAPNSSRSTDPQGGRQPTTTVPLVEFPETAELSGWCPLDTPAVHLHQLETAVTTATVCTSAIGAEGGSTITVNTVDGGLDALLAAYAAPNAPLDNDVVCTLQLEDPLLVWLTYPGERTYPVYAPVDACGFPTSEAKAAFSALTLTPVASFGADGAPVPSPLPPQSLKETA